MTNKTILVMIVTVFVVGFLTQNAFAASVDYFLKIDGIPGESTDDRHKDWINLESWSWGATQAGTSGGGGGGAGKVIVDSFSFGKTVDKASPKLFESLTTGKHLKDVTLELCRSSDDGRSQCYLTIKLTDVLISGYQIGGSGGSIPTDQFSLNFAKIEFEYKPQKVDGTLDAPVKAGYDVKANKKV